VACLVGSKSLLVSVGVGCKSLLRDAMDSKYLLVGAMGCKSLLVGAVGC